MAEILAVKSLCGECWLEVVLVVGGSDALLGLVTATVRLGCDNFESKSWCGERNARL